MEKLGKYNINKVFERIYQLSDDPHNIHTPLELCDQMLDKIPELGGDILVMFNLEFLYKIKERINNLEDVWFITPCEKKALVAEKMGTKRNHIRYYSYKDKEVKGIETMPKFDVVVGNPPYQVGMHLKFLDMVYDLSQNLILWICPSQFLIDRRKTNKNYEELKNKIGNNIREINLINGNPLFNIGLFVPLSILLIDKSKRNGDIKIEDKIRNKNFFISNINDINKWSDTEIYPLLEKKILDLSDNDNLYNHQNKRGEKYVINLAYVRGHSEMKDSNSLLKDDFYTLFPSDRGISKKIEKEGKRGQLFFTFKTDREAQNFLDFMKTRWGMFSLSIFKNDQNIGGNFLASVPWLDWSQSWTEKDFEELIGATQEEKEFVYKNIPDYYGIAKKTK